MSDGMRSVDGDEASAKMSSSKQKQEPLSSAIKRRDSEVSDEELDEGEENKCVSPLREEYQQSAVAAATTTKQQATCAERRVRRTRPVSGQQQCNTRLPIIKMQQQQQPIGSKQLDEKQQVVAASGEQQTGGKRAVENICAACCKPIKERYLLVALDKQWHEDCLKCDGCNCRLGEVGRSLFTRANKILCRTDFLRIFGQRGHCAACKKEIPPYEMVMRANELAYHMDCFACQQCQYRFCVGDQFHLTNYHRIICIACHRDQQQQQHQHQHQQNLQLPPSNTTATTTPPATTTTITASNNTYCPLQLAPGDRATTTAAAASSTGADCELPAAFAGEVEPAASELAQSAKKQQQSTAAAAQHPMRQTAAAACAM